MTQKPSIPKGTRDFNPEQVSKRNYIFNIIKKNFKAFGFLPIETPSFENSETLMGKYGDEGDRLIFKILNSGEYLKKIKNLEQRISQLDYKSITPYISEKALRYDLTVPFARYVVQHQNDITFPFKRYQIQPVWRADRPQKGRFREFYQCDADVVGSKSLWQEVECIQLYDAVFTDLNLEGVTIKINNRKVLSGIAEVIGIQDKFVDFTVALDKLDKIGEEKVKQELLDKGISTKGIEILQPIFSLEGAFKNQLSQLKTLLHNSKEGMEGLKELEFVFRSISELELKASTLQFDVTLARGLNYYTGAIFEVTAPPSVKLGSIGGGGRYNDLTSVFGLKNVGGIGISFGLDRIFIVLEELSKFPETVTDSVKILFLNFGQNEALQSLKMIKTLRTHNISTELYPDSVKIKKQMNYANKRHIQYVAIIGEEELKTNTIQLKNMISGEQQFVTGQELIKFLTESV